jgi:hypothetical protein
MNTNNVVSLPVAADLSANSEQHKLVYMTATGINLVTTLLGATATSKYIGTLLRGNNKPDGISSAVGMSAAVHLACGDEHFVKTDATAILVGSELELSATDGVVALSGTTASAGASKVGIALEANGSTACVIRAILWPAPNLGGV